jgi:hypothetical protein
MAEKEEKEKRKKDETEAARSLEEEAKAVVLEESQSVMEETIADFSHKFHDIMNGVKEPENVDEDSGNEDKYSPVKNRPESSKSSSR